MVETPGTSFPEGERIEGWAEGLEQNDLQQFQSWREQLARGDICNELSEGGKTVQEQRCYWVQRLLNTLRVSGQQCVDTEGLPFIEAHWYETKDLDFSLCEQIVEMESAAFGAEGSYNFQKKYLSQKNVSIRLFTSEDSILGFYGREEVSKNLFYLDWLAKNSRNSAAKKLSISQLVLNDIGGWKGREDFVFGMVKPRQKFLQDYLARGSIIRGVATNPTWNKPTPPYYRLHFYPHEEYCANAYPPEKKQELLKLLASEEEGGFVEDRDGTVRLMKVNSDFTNPDQRWIDFLLKNENDWVVTGIWNFPSEEKQDSMTSVVLEKSLLSPSEFLGMKQKIEDYFFG